MSLIIAVCLLFLSASSDANHCGVDHHHPQAVTGRYPPPCDPVTGCEDLQIMPENTNELLTNADTMLSPEDILNVTLKYCNDILATERAYTRDTFKAERDHATLKIGRVIENQETIFKALSCRIQDIEASDKNQQHILERISKLEQKTEATTTKINNALEILEESITNVNLKTHTKILYQEKLLYSLKHALFDTLSVLKNDKLGANERTVHKSVISATSNQANHTNKPINVAVPQLDGNDSIEVESDDELTEVEIYEPGPAHSTAGFTFDDASDVVPGPAVKSSDRTANFILNKEKQVLSLGADTKLEDFDITVNDDNKNVGIQCSSAFYQAIARPILCGFEKQTEVNVSNIPVTCNHIDYNRDKTGVEYNRVLHIYLGGTGKHALGKVTIHLHHTKRLIQMQGSAIMADRNKAPVWFLNNYIKERFTNLAASKQVNIATFNKRIEDLVRQTCQDSINNTCSKCMKNFSVKSVPTLCSICQKLFHKTCLPSHSSSCQIRRTCSPARWPSPSSSPSVMTVDPAKAVITVPTAGSFYASSPTIAAPTALSITTIRPSSSISSTGPGSRPLHTNPKKRSRTDIDSSTLPHPTPPPRPVNEAIVPSASPEEAPTTNSYAFPPPPASTSSFLPAIISSNASLNADANPFNPSQPSAPMNNRRKTKAKQMSPEKSRIDFLNLELDAAKTKIVQLESDINDKEISIRILNEKIELLEQTRLNSLNNQYRNPKTSSPCTQCPNSPNTHNQHQHLPTSCSQYQSQHCHQICPQLHHHPSQQCYPQHVHCKAPAPNPDPISTATREQTTMLSEIKAALVNIKEGIKELSNSKIIKEKGVLDISNKVVDNPSKGNPSNNEDTGSTPTTPPDTNGNPNNIEVIEHDDSVASADFFVPEPSLNSLDPTCQLTQLMQ